MGGDLSFLIVGTPRSGTTLAQRLACEISGVAVPPETHFLYFFAADLYRRRSFPLDAQAIRDEIALYAALDNARELEVDANAVVDELGGSCRSILELFSALVRHLAGPADTYGEKTPAHVVWWEKLAVAAPSMKFVAVVRHPAAVVASWVEAWPHESWAAAAERWTLDQIRVGEMIDALGPRRALLLRFEDVVADPDAARRRLAAFLDHSPPARPAAPARALYLSWETWKRRSLGPVDAGRADAWRRTLTPEQVAYVSHICSAGMERFGYAVPDPLPPPAAAGSHRSEIERCRDERWTKLREAFETRVD
ncbi:MAG TPA: sulfotransferase [Actinomycetota bacterium]|nr:sulfotransferase [Actinomycetota bacterium]